MQKFIFFLLFFILACVALKTKKRLRRIRDFAVLENSVESPASYLIGELVAVAGGIYLSLVLLASFLKISMPERISFYDWSFDYLATIAVFLALLQPILLSLYYKMTKRI